MKKQNKKYTGLTMAKAIIEEKGIPLSSGEIFDIAEARFDEYLGQSGLEGKTPRNSLAAQLGAATRDEKNVEGKVFHKNENGQYFLSNISGADVSTQEIVSNNFNKKAFFEKDIYPLLVKYLRHDENFGCYTKITDSGSKGNNKDSTGKWKNMDCVGIVFQYGRSVFEYEIANVLNIRPVKIVSFEVKKELTMASVIHDYFEAIANSSWANEGYLVALDIGKNVEKELAKLNAEYGIGVISIIRDKNENGLFQVKNSRVLFYSRKRQDIDAVRLDEMLNKNDKIQELITTIVECNKISTIERHIDKFEKVLSDDELSKYIENKF